MRAAEHHRVHARIEVRKIPFGDGIDGLSLTPAFFGQRHEYLARHLGDMRLRAQCVNGLLVGATRDRAFGREHGVVYTAPSAEDTARFLEVYDQFAERSARSLQRFDLEGLATFRHARTLVERRAPDGSLDCTGAGA